MRGGVAQKKKIRGVAKSQKTGGFRRRRKKDAGRRRKDFRKCKVKEDDGPLCGPKQKFVRGKQ